MKTAVVFVGTLDDGGFNSSALIGAEDALAETGEEIEIVDGVPYDQEEIRRVLDEVADRSEGIVFIGGQGNLTMPDAANSFPDKRFAVVQGNVIGSNLASYEVLQEESAFLAGCLAARITDSGIIGHLSGHRVPPGLKGRAAYVAGATYMEPDVQVLTGFCGTQDDNGVSEKWAAALVEAGADPIFTMLNGARSGAIAACRRLGARQIGNALNWCERAPEIFIASALARIDLAVRRAIVDIADGVTPKEIVKFGIADGDAVSLAMHTDLPDRRREEIAKVSDDIRGDRLKIPTDYVGPEFRLDEDA